MARLSFPTAGRYDTRYLLEEQVTIKGFDIDYQGMGELPWPLFHDMVTDISYDIAEQAFSHYLIALDQGKPLTALPVFPSRFFPQLGTTVNRSSGVEKPADLVGKRVAVLGFGYNPAAWMRGILENYYRVPVKEIVWVEDADNLFLEGLAYQPADGYRIERIPGIARELFANGGMNPVSPLENGVVDALIAPGGGAPVDGNSRRLLTNPAEELANFVQSTGVFPINTLITLKRGCVEQNPRLPQAMMEAFREARECYQHEVEQDPDVDHMGIRSGDLRAMGLFPDRYGLEENRTSIEAIIDFCFQQGLIQKRYQAEQLFCI